MGEVMRQRTSDLSPVFQSFIEDVRRLFGYLVGELGFELAETRVISYECTVTFRKANLVAVTVARDAGALPWVMLTGNTGTPARYRSEEIPLDVLIATRCPERQRAVTGNFPVSDEVVREVLQYYADTLRHCAADILSGDVTGFRDLRKPVAEEYARRMRAMKEEEKAARRKQP
jgi:hypothetical protein